MKRLEVGMGQSGQSLGRRAWLRLAGAAVLGGIARGAEPDPADQHDPPPRDPAADELEQAGAEARRVTSKPLAKLLSAHYQAVGDASALFMKQVLLECENIALDFLRYYRSLGFEVERPDRRLTLVIFRDEGPFFQLFRGGAENLAGVYSRPTNFLYFYDLRNVQGKESRAGRINMITIAHEATHQLTFNTGLLNRNGDIPKCLVEGLAVYGEIRSRSGRNEPGRVLHGRLDDLAAIQWARNWVSVTDLLTIDANGSYAQSWLLVHFLMKRAERLPQFRAYLKAIYPRTDDRQRLEDARVHFGDLNLLDRELRRYAIELRRSS